MEVIKSVERLKIKTPVSELKSTLDRISSIMDFAEEMMSELECTAPQLSQIKHRKKTGKK